MRRGNRLDAILDLGGERLRARITTQGRAFLVANRPAVAALLARMAEASRARSGGDCAQILRATENGAWPRRSPAHPGAGGRPKFLRMLVLGNLGVFRGVYYGSQVVFGQFMKAIRPNVGFSGPWRQITWTIEIDAFEYETLKVFVEKFRLLQSVEAGRFARRGRLGETAVPQLCATGARLIDQLAERQKSGYSRKLKFLFLHWHQQGLAT